MRQQFCRPDFDVAFCAGGTLRARVSRRSLLRIIGAAELRGAIMDYAICNGLGKDEILVLIFA